MTSWRIDDLDRYHTSRRSLHGVAEALMAGPQYRRSGTIRLRPTADGFSTIAAPFVRLRGLLLVGEAGDIALSGSYRDLADALGVDLGAPEGLYHDHADVAPDDQVSIDADDAALLAAALACGEQAMASFAPGTQPVLWPEHFDLGITQDQVNYGVSPGDSGIAEPYAYVGPWSMPEPSRRHAFWNTSFGAARMLRELHDASGLEAFFVQGRQRAASD